MMPSEIIFDMKKFKGKVMRFDIEVNGILFAADVSKKYRNGRYVNVRLNQEGKCWGSRNYMFSGNASRPHKFSDKTIAAFFIENNGNARLVMNNKEKMRNLSDKDKTEADWRPYALALKQRVGENL